MRHSFSVYFIMSIFKNRPLALGCALFLISLYFLYSARALLSFIVLCIGAVALIAVPILMRADGRRIVRGITVYLIPIAMALILSALVSFISFRNDEATAKKYFGATDRFEVLVEDIRYESDFYSIYVGRIDEIGQSVVLMSYDYTFEIGQLIDAELSLYDLNDAEKGYSEKDTYKSSGIYIKAVCNDTQLISEGNYDIKMRFRLLNLSYCERISEYANKDTSGIVSALFLGNKKGLSTSDSRDFARLGISHILALSGMHLSIIASVVGGIINHTGIKRRKKYLLTLAIILCYIGLTGFSESVMRAGVMLIILYTMFFFKQKADFITEIFLSVTLICMLSPYSILSISLLLSFLAMLGCVISSFMLSKKRRSKIVAYVKGGIITTFFVSLTTLPLAFMNFGFVSVVSPIANLIFIPLFNLLLYLSPLLLLLGGVPYLGEGIVWLCEGLTDIILFLTGSVAPFPNIAFPLYTDIHGIGIVTVALAIVMIMVLSRRRLRLSLAILVLGLGVIAGQSVAISVDRHTNTYVTTYGDDSGDRTYLESEGEICVIDGHPVSKSSLSNAYYNVSAMGYLEIDTYIITDYNSRICKALDMLTDSTYVRRVVLPSITNENELLMYLNISEMLGKKNVEVVVNVGNIEFNGKNLRFLVADFIPRSNKRLCAYSIEGETSRYTYIGASVHEGRRGYEFAQGYISGSDAVYFGRCGPDYKYSFKYDLKNVKYCMFSTKAVYYCNCETEKVRTVLQDRRFILN